MYSVDPDDLLEARNAFKAWPGAGPITYSVFLIRAECLRVMFVEGTCEELRYLATSRFLTLVFITFKNRMFRFLI